MFSINCRIKIVFVSKFTFKKSNTSFCRVFQGLHFSISKNFLQFILPVKKLIKNKFSL